MQLNKIFFTFFCLVIVSAFSQKKIKQLDKVQVDILYNYYDQDGDNGAVTGGKGSEKLDNTAPQISISIPITKLVTVGATLGLDHYTSASTSNIDKYGSESGAVRTKKYGTITSASVASYYDNDYSNNTTSASSNITNFYENYLEYIKDKYGAVVVGGANGNTPTLTEQTNAVTSASSAGAEGSNVAGADTRRYFSVNFSRLLPENNSAISFTYGYSKEFDVMSNYGKFVWEKESLDKNKFLNIIAGIFIDKWLLIYPGEIRAGRNTGAINKTSGRPAVAGRSSINDLFADNDDDDDDDDDEDEDEEDDEDEDDDNEYDDDDDDDDDYEGEYQIEGTQTASYETDKRYTYNVGVTYGGNINQRLNASITGEVIFQKGILNTPFHRVYFNDGIDLEENKLVKVEKLPRSRVKKAIGLRSNYYMTKHLIARLFYRYYFDDFGINAHTLELEMPIKISKSFRIYPFYRFHTQTAADYFRPYGEHNLNAEFYTSDYDLAKFTTNKYGIGFKVSPSNGLIDFKINKKREFQWKMLEARFSNYRRSTGLNGSSITLGTTFTF